MFGIPTKFPTSMPCTSQRICKFDLPLLELANSSISSGKYPLTPKCFKNGVCKARLDPWEYQTLPFQVYIPLFGDIYITYFFNQNTPGLGFCWKSSYSPLLEVVLLSIAPNLGVYIIYSPQFGGNIIYIAPKWLHIATKWPNLGIGTRSHWCWYFQ